MMTSERILMVKNEIKKAYGMIINFRETVKMTHLYEELSEVDIHNIAKTIASVVDCIGYDLDESIRVTNESEALNVAIIEKVIEKSMLDIAEPGNTKPQYQWVHIDNAQFEEIVNDMEFRLQPELKSSLSRKIRIIEDSFAIIMCYRSVMGLDARYGHLNRDDINKIAKATLMSSTLNLYKALGVENPAEIKDIFIETRVLEEVIAKSIEKCHHRGFTSLTPSEFKEIINKEILVSKKGAF